MAKSHVAVLHGSSGTLLNHLSAACPHRTLVKEIHTELHAAGVHVTHYVRAVYVIISHTIISDA